MLTNKSTMVWALFVSIMSIPLALAKPIAVWQTSITDVTGEFKEQTLRQTIQFKYPAQQFRIRFNNSIGTQPILLSHTSVGLSAGSGNVETGTQIPVTFGGNRGVIIGAGSSAWSDPIKLSVASMQRIAVSFYIPNKVDGVPRHFDGRDTIRVASGNKTDQITAQSFYTYGTSWYLIDAVTTEISTRPPNVMVVTGDSISEGFSNIYNPFRPTDQDYQRYSDFLVPILKQRGANYSVVNTSINGGVLVKPGAIGLFPLTGEPLIKRYERDILAVPGVTDAMIMIGTNDLAVSNYSDADAVINSLKLLTQRLQQKNIRVTLSTITPTGGFQDLAYPLKQSRLQGIMLHGREEHNIARQKVNTWIRTQSEANFIVDMDVCVRDPKYPNYLKPVYDSGDHLHPSPAGYHAMAKCLADVIYPVKP